MPKGMVLLVGEQPAPNLLPARYFKSELVLLVYTTRTYEIAKRLKALLEPRVECELCEVNPYYIVDITAKLSECLSNKTISQMIFNVTGGTKPMVLAAFQLAQMNNNPIIYFQTEGNENLIFYYEFINHKLSLKYKYEVPETLNLDEYLKMYLGQYITGQPRNEFEMIISEILKGTKGIDEVFASVCPQGLGALEIDFVVRCGNRIGVGEVKTRGDKSGIDQINAVTDQRFFGTYVNKFLITGAPMHINNINLSQAYRIEVIEVSYCNGALTLEDPVKVMTIILQRMGIRKNDSC